MVGFERITFDPEVMGGRACIRGLRVTVSLILNLVANGMTPEEIVGAYPYLEVEDIRESLRYAAWLAEEQVYLEQGAAGSGVSSVESRVPRFSTRHLEPDTWNPTSGALEKGAIVTVSEERVRVRPLPLKASQKE